MNTTGQKVYWDWLETFAAGRPFKADDENALKTDEPTVGAMRRLLCAVKIVAM